MNLVRSLSRHQLYCLKEIAKGELILVFDPESGLYMGPKGGTSFRPGSKPRGARLMRYGNHLHNSLNEMLQRGLLHVVDGRILPSKAAQRQFGTPPELHKPKRTFKMSRTRAARNQEAA